MLKHRVEDGKTREMLELAATELAEAGRNELAEQICDLLTELIAEPVEYGCTPQGHEPYAYTAAALKACNWANTPMGNKVILSKAIQELQAGHPLSPDTATALKDCDWSNMPLENKAIISLAINGFEVG